MEWDLYAGYSSSINEDFSYSLTVVRFEYPSEGDAFDYMEFGGSISYGDATAGIMLSQEYLGDGGPAFQYPFADYSYAVNDDVTLDLHIGMSMVDMDDFFGDGEDSYVDLQCNTYHTVQWNRCLCRISWNDARRRPGYGKQVHTLVFEEPVDYRATNRLAAK